MKQKLYNQPVSNIFHPSMEGFLPPKSVILSDLWKSKVAGMTGKARNARWPGSFESHSQIHTLDIGYGDPARMEENGKTYYAVAWKNRQLHGSQGRLAGLERNRPGSNSGAEESMERDDEVISKGTQPLQHTRSKRQTNDQEAGEQQASQKQVARGIPVAGTPPMQGREPKKQLMSDETWCAGLKQAREPSRTRAQKA